MSDGGLQFEKAEFADGAAAEAAACGYCGRPLGDSYWSVDGKPACLSCKDGIAARGTEGSGFSRFARAVVFGSLAGAVGAGIWYAIGAITGWQIGLISILVGLAVGGAVKAGSYGRGGPLYQALAIFITYTAICGTYVPDIVQGARESGIEHPVAIAIVALPLAYAAPFLGGFENILGIAIIAFGLYEAWKINRRQRAEISGPHAVAAPVTLPSAVAEPSAPGSPAGG
jgi:hypothetical protein